MADKIGNVQSIANIPSSQLREIFRSTMVMGMPQTVTHRPTFYWDRQVTFAEYDSSENPWDWQAAPVLDVTPASQQVICAYEFSAPFGRTGTVPERVGEFNISTVELTVLEDEYAVLDGNGSGFSYVTIGPNIGTKWYFRYVQPSTGLGDLTVYTITCGAEDT